MRVKKWRRSKHTVHGLLFCMILEILTMQNKGRCTVHVQGWALGWVFSGFFDPNPKPRGPMPIPGTCLLLRHFGNVFELLDKPILANLPFDIRGSVKG